VRFKADAERQDVQAALEYIHAHFGEKITETTVAALCGMNRFQFSRAFSKTQGVTFHEYLIAYRMREACRLFQNPRISVTEAALMVGFSDVSHFGRMFKRHCGVLPSTYRTDALQLAKAQATDVSSQVSQRALARPSRLSVGEVDESSGSALRAWANAPGPGNSRRWRETWD
jgi:AraC-like DNA-binding protein